MTVQAEQLERVIAWYRAMGVEYFLDDAPRDWFAEVSRPTAEAPDPAPEPRGTASRMPPPPVAKRPVPPPRVEPAPPALPSSGAEMAARELAGSAPDLATLARLVAQFEGCTLRTPVSRLCFARGRPDARLMMIGEAPGRDEDRSGVPFVGRAGQLLDRMLAAIGLGADDAYITNLVFWRPMANRTPSLQEVQACQPFVERQIELVSPEILVFLGAAAAKQLTGAEAGILKLRGRWLTYGPGIKAIATLHPAYLLRNPIAKRLAWRDLLMIRAALDGEAD